MTPDQVQMSGIELGLLEMSEQVYLNLQHLLQVHPEAQAGPPVATVTLKGAMSPLASTQAIDLSTSTDEPGGLVLLGDKTPASYGEVPGYVLAKVVDEGGQAETGDTIDGDDSSSASPQKRSRSAARVCLEKRFNTVSADAPLQPDTQSAVQSNFFTILSAEAPDVAVLPHTKKWMKPEQPLAIGHVPHMEPKYQTFIIPRTYCPERFAAKSQETSGSGSAVTGSDVVTAAGAAARKQPDGEPGSSSRKRTRSHLHPSQRRENHNNKERERRKQIRSLCDELNTLVPFCKSDTDKVTTLRWTAAFLRFINKTHGDTFKEEFKKSFADEKEQRSASEQQDAAIWLSASLVAEQ